MRPQDLRSDSTHRCWKGSPVPAPPCRTLWIPSIDLAQLHICDCRSKSVGSHRCLLLRVRRRACPCNQDVRVEGLCVYPFVRRSDVVSTFLPSPARRLTHNNQVINLMNWMRLAIPIAMKARLTSATD